MATAFDTQTRTLVSQAQLARPAGRVLYWTVFWVLMVLFALVFLFPLYWMITGGLKSPQEIIQTPPTVVPHAAHPGNYSTAWQVLHLGRLLWNTAYYALGALALQLVFDVAAAYAISKLRPIFGNAVLFAMLATLMIPTTVIILPTYLTANSLPFLHVSLINTPWAIWLPSVANAFNIFLLKRFFDSIPTELLAAAAVDGAGPMRTLWSIVLPMSRPILGVVSIFAVVAVWKDFLWPLLTLPKTSVQTVNVGLNQLSVGISQNVFIAALAIACVPTVVFFLIFQRNIMSGLTAGAMKG
ncbi:carbohydrate ABC transporter permease [Streptomyces sp. SL13]|jgi:multiple sugar transport system permease protein|uniref:Carbohydrate ABC transporter permease n=1 Tax=Streptantibioticus silvisoli TaxID=2705255 RepID=A0AA90KG09_9ACTN|nr:carbohydrate ABC transporter permease [Streptantibioticus silvisoli]MDI5963729.1 carbohydrate ABC transporter permease [Streptantibioticus silvisoli]MDI5969569.1 carbohydrate ABC transporter permease [Streptantibioticus silvisoli]